MSGGGKGSEKITVGYKYFMGVQLGLAHGPLDAIRRIIIGEREAWEGSVTSNTNINIDKPELFGGEKREGGVKGRVDIIMGGPTQARNSYLAQFQGADCPAYRGIACLVFRSFMWSAMNPYFKAPWVEATRVLRGWQDNDPWNEDDAYIDVLDMNPAHIIYQCLTDPSWGMGYTAADIGSSFVACATKLKTEGFGLSLIWDTQSTIEDFVKIILDHINATLALDLVTGKFELRLIRDDYNPDDLVSLNESNVLELKSFQRAAFGDSANEVVVTYTDRNQNKKTVAVQDLASIQAQGGVISTSREYPGIRKPSLAAKVALRDLKILSAPLAQVAAITNRVLWDHEIGDVVKLYWSSLGINGVVFRIIEINKGTLTDSKIEVKMIEDVFGLPANNYTEPPPSQWVDTVVPPIAADVTRAVEATYWDIVHTATVADQAYFEPGYGFGFFMAGRGAVQSTLGYSLMGSADDVTYSEVGGGNFNPTGTIVGTLTRTAESFSVTAGYDLDVVVLADEGGYCIIDDECMSVISCNPSTGFVEVERGILDTVPRSHAPDARVFFITPNSGIDPTQRTAGETVYYKPLPQTGIGTLPLDEADTEVLVLNNRASRPYPPGNLKVDGAYYPVLIAGPDVAVTWAHRDRTQQTVDFFDYKTGNIGPEPGTTYVVRLYTGATLLHTYEVDGTSWQYPTEHDDADGNLPVLTVKVWSKCNGLESIQAHDHTFQRSVVVGNVGIEYPPLAPELSSTDWYFANRLSWVPGDARTNIEKFELRVADVPDITKSTIVEYIDYPITSYEHALGAATGFRWYWVRTYDVNGQISEWSNIASARALATDPITMLNDINALLTAPDSPYTIRMISDRFIVEAPDGSKIPFAVVEVSPGVWKTLLNSDVLIGGNVDIANLTTGSLLNDVILRLGGGIIELDGQGEIRVFKDLLPNSDFVRLASGEIRFLRYIGGAYQTYNYLSRYESGVANNGDVVVIPGYWKSQPKMMVSPAVLPTYKKDYAAQDQVLTCSVTDLQEVVPDSGVWQFVPRAELSLGVATGGAAINQSSGDTSSNNYTTPTQTTPANCITITPSLVLKSNRGNGASQYFRRTVRWRVQYFSTGVWVNGAWNNVNIGDQLGTVNSSAPFTFPSAATWQWRINYEAFDKDGTVFGATSYEYSEEVKNGGTVNDSVLDSGTPASATTKTFNYTLPVSSINTSWDIYQIRYKANYTAAFKITSFVGGSGAPNGTFTNAVRKNAVASITYTVSQSVHGSPNQQNYSYSAAIDSGLLSGSSLTYNRNYFSSLMSADENLAGFTPSNPQITMQFTNGEVTIRRRRLTANSTTPSNNYTLSAYGFNLTSALVLAAGSLNWQATGE